MDLLIREKREDEVTEKERETHRKRAERCKEMNRTHNSNTWVIKSKVQDEVLEFGKQKGL